MIFIQALRRWLVQAEAHITNAARPGASLDPPQPEDQGVL